MDDGKHDSPRRDGKDEIEPGPPNAWPAGGAPPTLPDPIERDDDHDGGDGRA